MTDGQAVAKIVLEAHRDDIQGKIDKLWEMDDKSLESIERHKLEHMLNKVNEALEWAKGRDKEDVMIQSGDKLLGRVCTKTGDMTFSNLPEDMT